MYADPMRNKILPEEYEQDFLERKYRLYYKRCKPFLKPKIGDHSPLDRRKELDHIYREYLTDAEQESLDGAVLDQRAIVINRFSKDPEYSDWNFL